MIIVSRPIPFKLSKKYGFCVPYSNPQCSFESIEKLLDYELEDEVAVTYLPSPIVSNFQDDRTPQSL